MAPRQTQLPQFSTKNSESHNFSLQNCQRKLKSGQWIFCNRTFQIPIWSKNTSFPENKKIVVALAHLLFGTKIVSCKSACNCSKSPSFQNFHSNSSTHCIKLLTMKTFHALLQISFHIKIGSGTTKQAYYQAWIRQNTSTDLQTDISTEDFLDVNTKTFTMRLSTAELPPFMFSRTVIASRLMTCSGASSPFLPSPVISLYTGAIYISGCGFQSGLQCDFKRYLWIG